MLLWVRESGFAGAVVLRELIYQEGSVAGGVFLLLAFDSDAVSGFERGDVSQEEKFLLVAFVLEGEAVRTGDCAASDGRSLTNKKVDAYAYARTDGGNDYGYANYLISSGDLGFCGTFGCDQEGTEQENENGSTQRSFH